MANNSRAARPRKAAKRRKPIAQGNDLGTRPQDDSTRGLDARATSSSQLTANEWAVVAHHYVQFDMTYKEAMIDAAKLKAKDQTGVVIVTNEAARRMIDSAGGAKPADAPDMRY